MVPGGLIADKSLGSRRALLYSAIYFSRWNSSNKIRDIVSYSGYTPKSGATGINGDIRCEIENIREAGYVDSYYAPLQPESFGLVYYSEFQKIISYKRNFGGKIHHECIVLVLAYIRKRMIKRHKNLTDYYSSLLYHISEDTGINLKYLPSYLDVLTKLDILYSEPLPHYSDEFGHWHTNVRAYVNKYIPGDSSYDCTKEFSKVKRHIINIRNDSSGYSYGEMELKPQDGKKDAISIPNKSDPDVRQRIPPIDQAHVQIAKPTSKSANPIAASFGKYGQLLQDRSKLQQADDEFDDQPSDNEEKLPF